MAQTHGGRDIFSLLGYGEYIDRKKHFKYRPSERTASSMIERNKTTGHYYLMDYGSGEHKSAIELYAEAQGLSINEAVMELAGKFSVAGFKAQGGGPSRKKVLSAAEAAEVEWDIEAPSRFAFKAKAFTEEELSVLGPKVTAELCAAYELHSLSYYITENEKGVTQIESTASQPIFAFICDNDHTGKKWVKIYQPKASDKSYRFFHKGIIPEHYIFGLKNLQAADAHHKKNWQPSKADEAPVAPAVVIASGGRDMLNIASMGYAAVCFGSERHFPLKAIRSQLFGSSLTPVPRSVYYCADLDPTGQAVETKLAWLFPSMRFIELPEEIKAGKDFRGHGFKDLTDFVKFYGSQAEWEFAGLVNTAPQIEFWSWAKENGKTILKTSLTNLRFFTKKMGFYAEKDPREPNGLSFVKIENFVRQKIYPYEIREAVLSRVKKMTQRNDIYEELARKNALKEASLRDLAKMDRAPRETHADYELIDIGDKRFEVSLEGIAEVPRASIVNEGDVWNKCRGFKIQKEPIFTVSEDLKRVEFLDTSNVFAAFLANTSKVFHEKELECRSGDLNDPGLTAKERSITHEHMISKLAAFGYAATAHKVEDATYALFALDADRSERDRSEGGTGKGLYYKGFGQIMPIWNIDGRDKNVLKDPHVYGDITPSMRGVLFNDLHEGFDEGYLYNAVTEGMTINPKNKNKVNIPFQHSPKFFVSSNYAISTLMEGSSERRFWPLCFSSYYHAGGGRVGLFCCRGFFAQIR